MADDVENNELRAALEAMFQCHIMSFVHTPEILSELKNDDVRIEALGDRFQFFDEFDAELRSQAAPKMVHNLTLGAMLRFAEPSPAFFATEYEEARHGLNTLKAKSLQGKTVIPTGRTTTLAAFMKGHGSASDSSGRSADKALGFTRMIPEDMVPHDILEAIDNAEGINLIETNFTFGSALKDEDGDEVLFNLLSDSPFADNVGNIWFPDMYTDNKVPSGLPPEVRDRLKKIKDDPMFAPLKRRKDRDQNKERTPIGKKEGISPITAYYIMRYLSPWLLKTNMVAQALPRADGKLDRIEILRNKLDEIELQTELKSLLSGEDEDGQETIDEMFPFEPIRTTYKYPENYPDDHKVVLSDKITEFLFPDTTKGFKAEFYRCPEPTDAGVQGTIKYGLLQKIHAVMSPARRSRMIQDIYAVFIEGSPSKMIKLLPRISSGKLANPSRPSTYYAPVAKNGASTLDYTEVVIALIEADMKGLAKEDTLKLITNTEKNKNDDESTDGREHISEGAVLIVPALLLLFAEKSNQHAFFDIFYGYSTKGVVTQDGSSRINRLTGFDYIEALLEFCSTGNDEDQIIEKQSVLADMLGNTFEEAYQCIVQPARESVKLVILGEDDIRFTLTMDAKTFSKGIQEEAFESELQKNNKPFMIDAFAEQMIDESGAPVRDDDDGTILYEGRMMPYNSNYTNKESEVFESVEAFAETTGDIMRRASPYGARAFNALGYLVEESMLNSALSAVDTVQGFSASSDFDRLVISLIGTNQYPGIASVHAAYHYQFLLQQMISPIKNWNVVDADLFTQGTFLALESFFDKPAMKALYYMLNKKGYISVGGTEKVSFFEVPKSAAFSQASFTGLQNGFAQMVIGYYRLMFAQIRNRLVIARSTKESRTLDETTADIKTLWKNLIVDSIENAPDPKMFALVLRYIAEESVDSVVGIPTWMPVLPDDMLDTEQRNENEPSQYLKWAYGSNAADLEFFAEVAAGYHAAKALSYHDNYPKMIKRFVESVDEDSGHAFLFAILLSNKQPDLSSATPMGAPVQIVNFMEGVQLPTKQQQVPVEGDEDEDGDNDDEGGTGEDPPGAGPPTQDGPERPLSTSGASGILKEIKSQSERYMDGDIDPQKYQQNLQLLIAELKEEDSYSGSVPGSISGISIDPIAVFDENNQGLTIFDEENFPEPLKLNTIASKLLMMQPEDV